LGAPVVLSGAPAVLSGGPVAVEPGVPGRPVVGFVSEVLILSLI
jgi:hypothetical protein